MISNNPRSTPISRQTPSLWQLAARSLANLSLRAKLTLAFLGVTVLAVGSVTLITNQIIRANLTRQVGTNLHALAQTKADQIAALLDKRLNTLQVFVLNPNFRDAVEATNAQHRGDPAEMQERLRQLDRQWTSAAENDPLLIKVLGHTASRNLRELQQESAGFIEIFVTNQAGELVGATQRTSHYDYSGEAWWQAAYNQGQGALYIGQPEFSDQNSAFHLIFAVPVRSRFDQEVIGVLGGTLDINVLTEALAAVNLGETGVADILVPSGQLIRSNGDFIDMEPEVLENLQAIELATFGEFIYEEKPNLVSLAPVTAAEHDEMEVIQQLKWKLIAAQQPAEALAPVSQAVQITLLVGLGALILVGLLALLLAQPLVAPIIRLTAAAEQIAGGDLSAKVQVESRDEIGRLAATFNMMIGQLQQTLDGLEIANKALEAQIWQTTGQAQLNDKMRGEQDMLALANSVIQQLCHYLQAQLGALYIVEDHSLKLTGSYAYNGQKPNDHFKFGDGLVGQTALEKKPMLVTDVPNDNITIRSGFNELVPGNIILLPFLYEEQVVGVIELGTLTEFSQAQLDFMETALASIAIAFNTAQARARIDELLAQTQQQAEELQAQSEELRVANEELENQAESLRASEAKLKENQAELEVTNAQLEEQAAALEENSRTLQEKQEALDRHNQELTLAQQELEQKAEELARASKYKSEFLANMSHELRTPLNSLLILARTLVDNKAGNLTEDQVESAEIIYSGGQDLLNLINDILDLSKVEAGQMLFNFEPLPLTELGTMAQAQFDHVAAEKGLELQFRLGDDLPANIETDPQRVKQIVKNLLSNAFKFTSQGSVSLKIYRPEAEEDLTRSGLEPSQAVAISVTDTGIGMTAEQQKIIFEAFQQADGSTNRQYGGTGLGLSICRELAAKLGGQIGVASEPEKGSTFTLYLPIVRQAGESEEPADTAPDVEPPTAQRPGRVSIPAASPQAPQPSPCPAPVPLPPSPPDDRAELSNGDKILLIIEDDPKFAKILYDFSHQKGLKCLIAGAGQPGLALVKEYMPEAIILDLNLPDISGWEVLEALKDEPGTRHIPVHIISADEEVLDAYRKGAIGYLTKPVSQADLEKPFEKIEQFIAREIKTILLVEDDANSRRSIKKLLDGSDVAISEAERGQTALELLEAQNFDCIILDLSLPDMTGFEVLNKMNGLNGQEAGARCPVIVYTGRDLTPEENLELMKYADSVIVKGVKSPERLLDETALFLHRVVAELPADKQRTIKQLYDEDGLLKDKKILIVDDDIRNSFALSKLLTDKGLMVRIAQNGQKALDLLAQDSEIDLVLMDIMMPVLDGYETTRRIRAQPEFSSLPILALTAKAMKGDREKCLAVGANDYLPKPIDVDRLFSMLRVWLYR
jgi:CheY-like chemotaxis protein/HAMP domain-containing protein/putative methionine-R-sulfoxide reductase with GAF domain